MGLLRGAGLVIASVLLLVSLLCSGIFLTLGMSLTYDNVNLKTTSIASTIIYEEIGSSKLDRHFPLMQEYCKQNPDYVFSEETYTFSLSCENPPDSTEEFVEGIVSYLVDDFYYKEYSCEFWNCFQEEDMPLFLVSKYAQNYWMNKFYTFFIVSLLLIGLIILLARKKANGLILTGSLMVVVSLFISKFKTIGTKIAEVLISPVAGALSEGISKEILSDFVGIFFSESSKVFLWMFVIGLVLIAVGILFKIFKIGFKISEKIEEIKDKNEKENLKKEVSELKSKLSSKNNKKK